VYLNQNDCGARIYTALAVQALIQLLFNYNHLWAPRIQWVFKEIRQLQKKPVAFEERLEIVLRQPDTHKLSELWSQTTRLLQKEKYSWIDHPEELL